MKKISLLVIILYIAAVTKASAQDSKAPEATTPADAPGYSGMFELGFLYGENNSNNNNFYHTSVTSPSLQLFNGYRFHRFVAIGGTLGFDFYENGMIAPVALGVRGNLLKTRVSPFYSLDAGYGFSFLSSGDQSKKKGGWMLNPAIGLKANNRNNTALTFSLGYKTQRASTDQTEWNIRTERKLHYKRMSVRLGYMF